MAEEIDLEFEDEGMTIITLEDEDGQDHEFEIIDVLEFHGNDYYALVPVPEEEPTEDMDGELVILRADEQDGEDYLSIIEDDDEYAEVVDLFMRKLSEVYGPDFIQIQETLEIDDDN